jgi:hypothetical protein
VGDHYLNVLVLSEYVFLVNLKLGHYHSTSVGKSYLCWVAGWLNCCSKSEIKPNTKTDA